MAENENKGIPIPDIIDPPESMSMTLCIPKNKDHMAAFFGALYSLTEWNSWQQNGTTDGRDVAAVWWRYFLSWNRNMSEEECVPMGQCCTDPVITRRVNPTTGMVEQSSDGGVTWKPASGTFQSVIVEPIPAVTSGVAATKCDAATNVSNQVDVWITQVSNDFTTATTLLEFGLAVIAAIATAVLVILTEGLSLAFIPQVMSVLGAALAAVWAVGKTVFDAYWTTDIKNEILCAAYCNISDDGSYTDGQFSAFWNRINENLPPAPAKMLFMGFLSSVGKQGLNAMAASGFSADADCTDCDCVCPHHCDIEWTFYGVHDVVWDGCNTYTMKADGGGVHVAFSSGDQSLGCFYTDGGFNGGSLWPVGSPSPVGGTNPKTTAIWNADIGNPPAETPYTFTFSSAPIT